MIKDFSERARSVRTGVTTKYRLTPYVRAERAISWISILVIDVVTTLMVLVVDRIMQRARYKSAIQAVPSAE
jgi:hypothetical protein